MKIIVMKPAVQVKSILLSSLSRFENPLISGLIAFIVYLVLAASNGPVFTHSEFPYFSYLADAFLHGQLNLRVIPSYPHDLIYYQGLYYLYWPPFPAIMSIPFVALFGVNFSDILLTLFISGFNVFLVGHLFRSISARGIAVTTPIQRALLVLFFAFGTVHLTLAPLGRANFTSQLIGFTVLLLAYLAAINLQGWPAFFFCGLGLTAAMLTRNGLLFAGLWPAAYLLWYHRNQSRLRLLGWSALGLLPIVAGGSLFLLYNYARFHNPFEIGLDYHLMASVFVEEYKMYGPFNIYYLPKNIFYQYISYPYLNYKNFHMGGSLFLLSPVFFYIFRGIKNAYPKWSGIIFLISILLVNVPILLLMGTGWVQFGPRYTLDFTVCLLVLTAIGIKNQSNLRLGLLTTISIIQYLIGTLILMRSL
jgi:hypothetical protein